MRGGGGGRAKGATDNVCSFVTSFINGLPNRQPNLQAGEILKILVNLEIKTGVSNSFMS